MARKIWLKYRSYALKTHLQCTVSNTGLSEIAGLWNWPGPGQNTQSAKNTVAKFHELSRTTPQLVDACVEQQNRKLVNKIVEHDRASAWNTETVCPCNSLPCRLSPTKLFTIQTSTSVLENYEQKKKLHWSQIFFWFRIKKSFLRSVCFYENVNSVRELAMNKKSFLSSVCVW
jgi:hypothetical protein